SAARTTDTKRSRELPLKYLSAIMSSLRGEVRDKTTPRESALDEPALLESAQPVAEGAPKDNRQQIGELRPIDSRRQHNAGRPRQPQVPRPRDAGRAVAQRQGIARC